MEAPFKDGVPYFSREEEAQARLSANARRNKYSVTDIYIEDDDIESFEFIHRVRQDVIAWQNRSTVRNKTLHWGVAEAIYTFRGVSPRKFVYICLQFSQPGPDFLNITPVGHGPSTHNGRGLNGYQKRLVHQLIRAEFPGLVSLSKHDFIQLIPYEKKREEARIRRQLAWFEMRMTSQVGLRWVVEAMCPGIDGVLPPQHAPPYTSGNLGAVSPWIYPPVLISDPEVRPFWIITY